MSRHFRQPLSKHVEQEGACASNLYRSWPRQSLLNLRVHLDELVELSEAEQQSSLLGLQQQLRECHGVELCHFIPGQHQVQLLLWLPVDCSGTPLQRSADIALLIPRLARLVKECLAPSAGLAEATASIEEQHPQPSTSDAALWHTSEFTDGCVSYVLPACFPLNSPACFLIKVPLAVACLEREQRCKSSSTGVYKGAVRILLMGNKVLSDQCEHILSNGTIRTRIPSIGSSCVLTLVILSFNGGILGSAPLLVLPKRAAEEVSSLFACMIAELSTPLLQLTTGVSGSSSAGDSSRVEAVLPGKAGTAVGRAPSGAACSAPNQQGSAGSAVDRVIDSDSTVEMVVTHAWQHHLQPFLEDFGAILSQPRPSRVQHRCASQPCSAERLSRVSKDMVQFLVQNCMPYCLETVLSHLAPGVASATLSECSGVARQRNAKAGRLQQEPQVHSQCSSADSGSNGSCHTFQRSAGVDAFTSSSDCGAWKNASVPTCSTSSCAGNSLDAVPTSPTRYGDKHGAYMVVAVQISLFLLLSSLLGSSEQLTSPGLRKRSLSLLISALLSMFPHVMVLLDWGKYGSKHDALVCGCRLMAIFVRLASQGAQLFALSPTLTTGAMVRHLITATMRRYCFKYKFSAVAFLLVLDVLHLPFAPEVWMPNRPISCVCFVLLGLAWLPWLRKPRGKGYSCKSE